MTRRRSPFVYLISPDSYLGQWFWLPAGRLRISKGALLRRFADCTIFNINEEDTEEDIRLYAISGLGTLNILPPAIKIFDVGRTVKQAASLFVWCSTHFKYLQESDNLRRGLQDFLSGVDCKV